MKKIKELVNSLMFNDIVKNISESQNITIDHAKKYITTLSFIEYLKLSENIVPPSGQTIGTTSTQSQKAPTATKSPQQIKAIWPGKGAPIEVGMTVGLKGPSGTPVPGEISQVDMSAKGVKVKNPTTGQTEWQNIDTLQPFVAQSGQPPATTQQVTKEDKDIIRIKKLAGITETASAGATGAGAIAVAVPAMGSTIKRQQPTEETVKKEYVRKESPKTIIGDTKPNQASGELSATLAANGKKTANRKNNGFKK